MRKRPLDAICFFSRAVCACRRRTRARNNTNHNNKKIKKNKKRLVDLNVERGGRETRVSLDRVFGWLSLRNSAKHDGANSKRLTAKDTHNKSNTRERLFDYVPLQIMRSFIDLSRDKSWVITSRSSIIKARDPFSEHANVVCVSLSLLRYRAIIMRARFIFTFEIECVRDTIILTVGKWLINNYVALLDNNWTLISLMNFASRRKNYRVCSDIKYIIIML